MDDSMQGGNEIEFPVDDETYDLLQSLTSKLEALDAYRQYIEDSDEDAARLYGQIAQDDLRHAQQLLDLVRQRLAQT